MSDLLDPTGDDLVRIRASRFEVSPFLEFHTSPGARFGVYANRLFPLRGSSEQEYWCLRKQSVLYDVPEKPIQVQGPDCVAFLERVFSRTVADLKEGRGRYAIACTDSGGVFMDGILFRLSEDKFWYVQADGDLETWLLAHSVDFDVEVSDPHSWVLQVQGPTSLKVLEAATQGAVNTEMGYFHAGFFEIGGQQVYVSRTGWTGEFGFEIYTQGDSTDYPKLWQTLVSAGEPQGMVVGYGGSMDARRIEAGILNNGTDMDRSMTPFEAGLGAFIDFGNPGFIGRDALLAAPRETRLLGVVCPGNTPASGWKVLDSGNVVGRVRTGDWSPTLESGIGYVEFEHASDWVGQTLEIQSQSGDRYPCEIVDLPFFDREKRLPRGLA